MLLFVKIIYIINYYLKHFRNKILKLNLMTTPHQNRFEIFLLLYYNRLY